MKPLDYLINENTYQQTNPWTGVPLQKGQKKVRKGNHPSNLQQKKKKRK